LCLVWVWGKLGLVIIGNEAMVRGKGYDGGRGVLFPEAWPGPRPVSMMRVAEPAPHDASPGSSRRRSSIKEMMGRDLQFC